MNHNDVIILGAGASGLLCAALCAAKGLSTLGLDHAARPAAKVRISGGGRCNLTNLSASPADYVCQNPHFVKSALARFTPADILAVVHAGGLATAQEDHGKIFCRQGASAVADLLVHNARTAGAAIRTRTAIHEVRHESGRFLVHTPTGPESCARLVVATGGLSWPRLGASDLGHRIAGRFGIPVVATRPGLVPLLAPAGLSPFCASLAGTALPVTIATAGPTIAGDLLFTHKGISGPAVLDASLHWSPSQPWPSTCPRTATSRPSRTAIRAWTSKTPWPASSPRAWQPPCAPCTPSPGRSPPSPASTCSPSFHPCTPSLSRPPAPRATPRPRSPWEAWTPPTSPPKPCRPAPCPPCPSSARPWTSPAAWEA